MRIVLFGPPGSGKGTQAAALAAALHVPAVSSGEIFRAHVADRTELGRRAQVFMATGDLVPDDLVVGMVAERLALPDAVDGFLLDGFPRTVHQAQALHEELAARSVRLDAAVELLVDDEELVRRMSTRTVLVDGVPATRDDDRPATIRHRLEVYRELTAPLSDFYAEHGVLVRIEATGDVDAIAARTLAALGRAAG